jgi:hypothetical protein
MTVDVVKTAVVVTLAALLQVVFVNAFELVEGRADFALVVLVALALLRGPVFGAVAGFWTPADHVSTLGTLGLASLPHGCRARRTDRRCDLRPRHQKRI